jgi:spore coat polysaccharide biosynthesis protein SpsF (cytidylyltransferase family)
MTTDLVEGTDKKIRNDRVKKIQYNNETNHRYKRSKKKSVHMMFTTMEEQPESWQCFYLSCTQNLKKKDTLAWRNRLR